MKKFLAVTVAFLLAISLFACAEQPQATDGSSSPDASGPVTSEPAPPTEEASPAAEDAGAAKTVGLHPDEVDHFARDPYKIVYMVCHWVPINASLSDQFEAWGEDMNYTYEAYNAQADLDVYLIQLQTFAAQGFDGFLLDFDNSISSRVFEISSELNIDWITALNPCVDENGHMLWPGVTLDAYSMGQTMTQWLDDNHTKYWGTIDPATLGLISIYSSDMPDLRKRGIGALDKFEELYPELTDNMYPVDIAGLGIAADVGYDKVAAVMSAHPEIEHWYISSCMESLAQGATRAAESLTKGDCTLVANVDAATLMGEWDGGYTGNCWVMCLFASPIYQTEPMICGLIAMIDGRATPETLWPDWIGDGEKYANLVLTPEIVTIDNYKQCLADAAAYEAQYSK